jgi:hypothetical protein
MARGFGPTRGVGTTDAIAATVNLSPLQPIAGFAFFNKNGGGGGGFGRIFDIENSACAFYIDNAANEFVFQYQWSGGTGLWRAALPGSGWHSAGFAYDPGSAANKPVIYIDGASVTVTQQSAPSGTASSGASVALRIGNRAAQDRNWDGDLARVAWWRNGSPTAGEFAAMHAQSSAPSDVQASTLIYYNSLSGGTTPSVGTNVSVTGTADRPDPPADTTPPTLTSPTGTGGVLTCSGSVSTDEDNGTLYAVVTASSTAPTAAQVKAGQDHTGSAALRVVSQAVSATGTQTIASGSVTAGTRYWHYMHEDAAGNQSAVVSSASFTVTAAGPTINTHPSNQTVTAPAAATFSVSATASGGSLTYQWQRQPSGGGGYSNISGATSASYTTGATSVTGGSHNNGDTYRCIVTDSNGSATSNAATLTVNAAPASLTSSPLKDNTGTLHLGAPFEAFVLNATTGALVVRKTGLTSNGSTGVVTFTDAALAAGTQYRVVWRRTDNGAQGVELLTAA